MYQYVVLLSLVSSVASVCDYTNQSPSSLIVTLSSGVESRSQFNISVGESFTVSCKASSQSLAYNKVTRYTCATDGLSVTLPVCVDKCLNYISLVTTTTSFKYNDAVVSGSVAAFTPLTISCSDHTAQSFGKSSEKACEEWTAEETCKPMCPISAYNTHTTIVSSLQLAGDYLPDGATLDISCISTYSLPVNTTSTIMCSAGSVISVTNCTAFCLVPTTPDLQTTYHSASTQLKKGQTFTVTCSGDKKLPYGGVAIAECQGPHFKATPHYSNGIPVCAPTCQVGAANEDTMFNITVSGRIRQGEGLHVSCKEGYLLPSPHKTPLTYVCENSGQFYPPSCQKQCSVPSALSPKSTVAASSAVLAQYQHVTVSCVDYYAFTSGLTERVDWFCKNGEVKITAQCYVYSKVTWRGSGTHKLSFTSDLPSDAPGDTTVTVEVGGISYAVTDAVTVSSYAPYTVTVKTVSEGSNVTQTELTKVYPGPAPPSVVQDRSTGSSVVVQLTSEAGYQSSPTYTLKYAGRLNTVSGTEYTITGLTPSSNYSLTLRTELVEAEGGVGDFSETPVQIFTGPAGVTNITAVPKDDTLELSWSAPAGVVTIYTIQMNNSSTFMYTPDTTYLLSALTPETDYSITVMPGVKYDQVLWTGDVREQVLTSGPAAPSEAMFSVERVSGSGTSLNISMVNESNMSKRAAEEYILFVNDEQMPITNTEDIVQDLTPGQKSNVIAVAQVSGAGWGKKLELGNFDAADCISLVLVNAKTDDDISFVKLGAVITVTCEGDTIFQPKSHRLGEIEVTCKSDNEYQYKSDKDSVALGTDVHTVECEQDAEKIISGGNNTLIYGVVAAVVFVIIIICIILIVMIHRRKRTTGSYNAKKAGEDKKTSMGQSPDPNFLDDEAFFENKYSTEILAARGYSKRSKATSYASQELRMEITDSDSGITEDILFNPALHSTLCFEDDNISTKSALV